MAVRDRGVGLVGHTEKLGPKTERTGYGENSGKRVTGGGSCKDKAQRWEPVCFIGGIGEVASVTQTECKEEVRLETGRCCHPVPCKAPDRVSSFIPRVLGSSGTGG